MTTDMMLNEIKSGKYDIEGCPIKSDALYEYVRSFENSDDQGLHTLTQTVYWPI